MKKHDLARSGHKHFSGIIKGIRVNYRDVGWPVGDIPPSGRFSGNNLFLDLRGKSWDEAKRTLHAEEAILGELEGGFERADLERVRNKTVLFQATHHGLELGTISLVYAISAAGGIPVSSCNGGSFGGCHDEDFPVVTFYWQRSMLAIIRQCAKETGTPMWTHHGGELVVGADYIRRFLLLAAAILERRDGLVERRRRLPESAGGLIHP